MSQRVVGQRHHVTVTRDPYDAFVNQFDPLHITHDSLTKSHPRGDYFGGLFFPFPPPFPFPSLFSFSISLCRETSPSNPAEEVWASAVSSHSGVRDRDPAARPFLCILSPENLPDGCKIAINNI